MPDKPLLPGAEPFFLRGNSVGCLLLHGLTGTPYEVRELGQRLNGAGYTVAGIRLPGHATRYQDLDTVTWRDWTDAVDVGWEMLAQRCDQVYLMGLSMGAVLALHAAANHPANGVVALSVLWNLPRWQVWLAERAVGFAPYQRKRSGSSIADPAAKAAHPTYTHMPMRAVLQADQLLATTRAALPQVTCPALLIHSRRDPVAPPAGAPLVLAALGSQDKALHWVERGAHIISEDYDKEEVFRLALAFSAGASQT